MVVVHRSLRPALMKQPMRFLEYMKGRHVQQKLDRKYMRAIAMERNRRNLDAALRTAEAGLPVFPVIARNITGSRYNLSPVYPSGPRTASRSPDKIASWWDEHIEAIPGIPCTSIVVL